MNLWAIIFYSLPIILQFLDWCTTKIYLRHDPLAEMNPAFHEDFKKQGVLYRHLFIKLGLGVYASVYLIYASRVPALSEIMLGATVWGVFFVVLNNALTIVHYHYLKSMDLWEPMEEKEMPKVITRSIFRGLYLLLSLTTVGVWIYLATGRSFLLWAAGLLLITTLMKVNLLKLYKPSPGGTS